MTCPLQRARRTAIPGPAVHLTLSRTWAEAEGLSPADAQIVAEADLIVDALWPGSYMLSHHFNPTALFWVAVYFVRAVRLRSLAYLGFALHSMQDSIGHGVLGMSHGRHVLGWMSRHPDVWETMPARTQRGIERSTRRLVRAYVRMTRGRS